MDRSIKLIQHLEKVFKPYRMQRKRKDFKKYKNFVFLERGRQLFTDFLFSQRFGYLTPAKNER